MDTTIPTVKRLYDESSDSCDANSYGIFKSPCLSKTATSSTLRARIIASFCSCPVVPVDSFSTAYCVTNDVMFDYRTSPCPIPKHSHSSLSKFLRCYSSVLEFLELKKLYVILKTKEAVDMRKRRLASHLVGKTDPMFKCCVEALCVNLFSTKVCLSFSDFLELFVHIYESPLPALVAPAQSQDFLCGLKSPNVILVKRNGTCTITLTPTHSPEYCEWSNTLYHKKIREVESLQGQEQGPDTLPHSTVRSEYVLPHSTSDSSITSLMAIADLNVPKLLQKRVVCTAESQDHSSVWRYLKQGVNFDGRRSYFTA